MSPEHGEHAKRTGSAVPLPTSKRPRLLTPIYNSSSEEVCDSELQPPPLPYIPGTCFDIKPNNPPPPYDGGYGYFEPDPKEWNGCPWPRGKGAPDTVVEQFLAHPPRKTNPHSDQTPRRLEVISQIRCGDYCDSQVVHCLVEGRELVAKIFDPLYVGLDDGDLPPTYFSERFYSCEAAAYEKIREAGLDGKFTPKFEGCWSLELPLCDANGHITQREVRLILQQFIPGDTVEALMERGKKQKIDPWVRMDPLARIKEVGSQLQFIGVLNDDVDPRNLIVAKDRDDQWHITMIDFSHSRVKDLPNSMWRTRRCEKGQLPESPITIWWGNWPPSCSDWVPKKYRGHTKESFRMSVEWVKERWEGTGKYEPVKSSRLRGSLIEDHSEDDAPRDDTSDDDTP